MQIGSANCIGPLLSAGKPAYPVDQTKKHVTWDMGGFDMSWTTFRILSAASVAAALAFTAANAQPGFSPIDRTDQKKSNQNTGLKPHPTPVIATPVDKIPLDKIQLPAGFKAELYSQGHPGGRTMVMGPKGTIFMGTRGPGRVYAVTNRDGKREVKVLLQGLTQPNGLAFRDGSLYVFAINQVFRYDNIEDKLDNPGEPVNLTKAYNLPDTIHH